MPRLTSLNADTITAIVQRYYKSKRATRVCLLGCKRPGWLPDIERAGGLETPLKPGTRISVRLQQVTAGGEHTVSEALYVEHVVNSHLDRAGFQCLPPMACADVTKLIEHYGEDDEALLVSIDGQMSGWPNLPGDVRYVVPKRLMPGSDSSKLICLGTALREGFARVALYGVNRVDGALFVELTMDF